MFIDETKVYVRAGTGGKGCVSFRREKCVPKGGPDGGGGGKGGDVYLQADPKLKTLLDFHLRPHIRAKNGMNGSGSNKVGRSAEDIILKVPLGTVVKEFETGEIITDLVEAGKMICIAKGGKGGRGNSHFVSSTHQSPREAEDGIEGEEKTLVLELKLLADVGLVGFPNAGKSTLLSRISQAKPKIADYPFTTLNPILGQVRVGEGKSFVVADLPGLIENAHQGVGLGHEFLRHIERTKVLIHIVDISPLDESDPIHNFETINKELELYDPLLMQRPQIVALNKVDMLPTKRKANKVKKELEARGFEVHLISALTGEGLKQLLYAVNEKLEEMENQKLVTEEITSEVI